MNIVYWIVLFLLIIPFYWVITDLINWKIRNYFIFPSIIVSVFITFFIEWFYSSNINLFLFTIIVIFWYLFYRDNKWWAWDWKYIILLWFNSIIISFLLWLSINILNSLFIFIFWILLIYNLFFLIYNYKKIININFKVNFRINIFNSLFLIFFIFVFVTIISNYIWNSYNYVIIFILMIILFPYLNIIKNNIIKIFIILLWITVLFYNVNYYSLLTISILFYIFSILQWLAEQIFNTIDIKDISLINIKQWNILTTQSIKQINKDINIEFLETPLQWNEVHEIILWYKEIDINPTISIYNDLKIGIIMYIGFILNICYNIVYK